MLRAWSANGEKKLLEQLLLWQKRTLHLLPLHTTEPPLATQHLNAHLATHLAHALAAQRRLLEATDNTLSPAPQTKQAQFTPARIPIQAVIAQEAVTTKRTDLLRRRLLSTIARVDIQALALVNRIVDLVIEVVVGMSWLGIVGVWIVWVVILSRELSTGGLWKHGSSWIAENEVFDLRMMGIRG